MKPNLKINQGIFAISILHIILFVIATIRRLNHFGFGSQLSLWLGVLSDLTFLIPLMYAIVLLKFAGERKYIVYYFTLFVVITGLNSILSYIPPAYSNYTILIIGIIISISIIGVIAVCFNVKNQILRHPFRGLAIAYILLLVINWGIPLLLPLLVGQESYFKITRYIPYTRILPGLGLAYIIYKAEKLYNAPELE